jgi:hypothetical protein
VVNPPFLEWGFLFGNIFINKIKIMRKVVRLTESDLVRIVKRVINEQDENECESLVEGMRYVFKDFMGYVKNSDGEESPEDLYDDLESELSGFLSQGEEMGCDNIEHLEEEYEKYLERFRELLDL